MNQKPIIYQLFPRLFTNTCDHCVPNGTIKQNGSGKMNDISIPVLKKIKDLGVTHVWYTGVIRHANKTHYKDIPDCNPHIVKGKAGSPYAITDYYDIDPDIAVSVKNRMKEFENLIQRTHEAGMKVIIDFVPNHVARQYHSIAKPADVEDLGANDNTNHAFSPISITCLNSSSLQALILGKVMISIMKCRQKPLATIVFIHIHRQMTGMKLTN